jgi:hypothetical protein
MRTEHVSNLLLDYRTGKLTEAESRLVKDHLRVCRACASETMQLFETLGTLQAAKGGSVAPEYFSSLLPRLRRRLEEGRSRNLFFRVTALPFVLPTFASALLMLIVFNLATTPGQDAQTNQLRAKLLSTIDTVELENLLAKDASNEEVESIVADSDLALIHSYFLANEDYELPDSPVVASSVVGLELGEEVSQSILFRLTERK